MNKLTLFLAMIILSSLSCKNSGFMAQGKGDGIHFGETIDTNGMISYVDLLSKISESDSIDAKVYGKVSGVCQAKGCWMNIVSEVDSTNTEMFVQFKDYGFFMPKDLAGKEVVMLGKAFKEMTSVEDLKHFAQDEGKTPEEIAKITKPVTELKFLASGVLIK
ncbi:MAG: DUF4920 domain-containing protein [Saprospiraceae bacterium]|jgi:hypothetical protein|nr:DUF4920 domain-containing protein [Saprospiraceae bacterium]MBL0026660.1 DUF4920 domain-containing protein [Saprospiraceae bacterium]